MKRGDEYTCAECGESYLRAYGDDKAWAEADANGFGDIPKSDMAIVCDDCYKAMGFG